VRYIVILLAIAGIVVSSLALKVHYDTGSEPCSINDKWDCGVVNHSPYAVLYGVPVAAIGIAGYLLIALLALLRRRDWVLATVLVALVFALCLTHIEKDVLGVWCLYCVISQVIVALIALLAFGSFVWGIVHGEKDFLGLAFLFGAVVGLLVVRGFFFDTAEELAWRLFWSGGWPTMTAGEVLRSATFAKCFCGILLGGIGAMLAVRRSLTSKTAGSAT
jgi:vitamin-K-epoxide reductase (warfarin-sensitive)